MIETHCKNCVFKIIDKEGIQTGCSLGRTEVLPLKEKTSDGYYVLSRFCNTYRPNEWLESLSFDESQDISKIVLEEIIPRFGFLIVLDTFKDGCIADLESCILDIVNQDLHKARYVIVVTDKVEYNPEIQQLLTKYFNFEETKYHIVQLIEKPQNKNLIIDEASMLFLNGWVYVTSSGEKINRNLLSTFNELINYKMKQISIILPYDEFNGFVFQTALFKFLNGNKIRMLDEEKFDNRPFLEKAKDLQTSEKTIFEWKDIYES